MLAFAHGAIEFLVKSVKRSTAEELCALERGDVVELSSIMGNQFDISQIDPPEKFGTIIVFAINSRIRNGLRKRKEDDNLIIWVGVLIEDDKATLVNLKVSAMMEEEEKERL
ncbi:Fruit protein [Arachis hypogaea]|nr:Fruit protein [Arachis hypogaea]